MADVAASVLARLKNKAAKSGRSYQLCLQLFCQEEFLRRLEKSKYAENLVLKGGLFLYSLTDFDSRVTADVDFLLRKMPNTPEQLQAILEGIIATQTGNDFITFEIKNVAPIAVAKKYAGIGASLVARIKNTKTPFGIDCSGFTQMVYKLNGYKLTRDASTQALEGEALSFIEESEPGDLAFFDNDEGNIIHVGIIMENNYIIHASGKVRIDRLDHTGIYNPEINKHTHKLRVIKKII